MMITSRALCSALAASLLPAMFAVPPAGADDDAQFAEVQQTEDQLSEGQGAEDALAEEDLTEEEMSEEESGLHAYGSGNDAAVQPRPSPISPYELQRGGPNIDSGDDEFVGTDQ